MDDDQKYGINPKSRVPVDSNNKDKCDIEQLIQSSGKDAVKNPSTVESFVDEEPTHNPDTAKEEPLAKEESIEEDVTAQEDTVSRKNLPVDEPRVYTTTATARNVDNTALHVEEANPSTSRKKRLWKIFRRPKHKIKDYFRLGTIFNE